MGVGRGCGELVRFRLLPHLSILFFIAEEPQKLDRQNMIFKNINFRQLTGIGKTLS